MDHFIGRIHELALLDGLLNQGKNDLASIRVHVRTIHMFAPGTRLPSEEHIELMLLELHKLLDFHNIVQPDSEDASNAMAR